MTSNIYPIIMMKTQKIKSEKLTISWRIQDTIIITNNVCEFNQMP